MNRRQIGLIAEFPEGGSLLRIRLRQIIRGLAPADLPAAVAAAARLPDRERSEILQMLGARWGETDPRAGLAFAESAREKGVRSALIASIAARWAALDPAAAVAWMNAKPADPSRREALANVVAELSHSDPALALSLLQGHPWREEDRAGYRDLFSLWAGRDPQAAGAAALAIAMAETRNTAVGMLAES